MTTPAIYAASGQFYHRSESCARRDKRPGERNPDVRVFTPEGLEQRGRSACRLCWRNRND